METQTLSLAPSAPLLRHDQVADMEDEIKAMEGKLQNPNFQGDRGSVRDQLIRARRQLEAQRPRPYTGPELDAAVAREAQLRDEIRSDGMLSHEEMRKAPPGAVDRHRAWERRNIAKIEEWKNLRLRLSAGSDEHEVASIENFRPTKSTMNMDGAQIQGKQFFLPPEGAAHPVVFTAEQIATIRALDPATADRLGTFDNAQRAEVKENLAAAETKKGGARARVEKAA